MSDEETLDDWRTNYNLEMPPHELANFWRTAGGVVGPVLALKAAVEEIERLRAALGFIRDCQDRPMCNAVAHKALLGEESE